MKIEIIKRTHEPEKVKGDFLEDLCKKFLETQGYEVTQQLRFTGMEIDLDCTHKSNRSKKIYVECKGYAEEKKVDSDIILKLEGIRKHNKIDEAWLVTTSDFNKEAKGLIQEISQGEDSKCFTFFSSDKLIQALVDAKIIKDPNIFEDNVLALTNASKLSKTSLIICERGFFWSKIYLQGNKPYGAILAYAENAELVKDNDLLSAFSEFESSIQSLDLVNTTTSLLNGKLPENNKPLLLKDIKLSPSYIQKIQDLGIKLIHPNKDVLVLGDVFVYPDLEEKDTSGKVTYKTSEILKDTQKENKKTLIFGDDLSGKTSLSLMLQRDLNNKNLISLYIDTQDIKKYFNFSKLENLLIKKFQEQYSKDESYVKKFKSILKTEKDTIVLIFDNFENLRIMEQKEQAAFLSSLSTQFPRIIIFANRSTEIEFLGDNDIQLILKEFSLFRLKEFGHVLRDKFIEKWLNVGMAPVLSGDVLYEKKDEITKNIKLVVGKNFIPTYPMYLLTILQLTTGSTNFNLQGSSYAELYGYLINKSLTGAHIKPADLDLFHTYLSHVAYFLFTQRKKEISRDEMTKFYREYEVKMDLDKRFQEIEAILIAAKIIKKEVNSYQFSHNYTYYYFVAKYFSDNMVEMETRAEIDNIIENLFTNEYANIVIFLIHHSKNKEIIDSIILEGSKLLEEIKPYSITADDAQKINDLIKSELKLHLKDERPDKYRKKELEEKDNHDSINKSNSIKDVYKNKTELSLQEKVSLSFKLTEILGQIVSNYYGSIRAEKKVEVLDTIHQLGFKGLRIVLEDWEQFQETLREKIVEEVRKEKKLDEVVVNKILDKLVFNFAGGIMVLFIKKMSDSISSKDLFKSLDTATDNHNTPGARLVEISVKLNYPNGLDRAKISKLNLDFKNNYLAKIILQFLVMEHLYKFDVNIADKQSICKTLGIDFPKNFSLTGR